MIYFVGTKQCLCVLNCSKFAFAVQCCMRKTGVFTIICICNFVFKCKRIPLDKHQSVFSKCVWAINTGRCLSEYTTLCLFLNTFLNTAFINSVFVGVVF